MTHLSKLGVWALTSAMIGLLGAVALVAAGAANLWLIFVLPVVVIVETGLFRTARSGLIAFSRRMKGY